MDLWDLARAVAGERVRCCKRLVWVAVLLSPGSPRLRDPLGTCKGESRHPRLVAPLLLKPPFSRLPLWQLALPAPVPMQLGLLPVFSLLTIFLLFLLLSSPSTTSGHRWFSPPLSLTAVYLRALPACPCPLPPARPACIGCLPPMPFPCFSQLSPSESLSCQAAAKAFFCLLSSQIDFSASKYSLAKAFCCLPSAFRLLRLFSLTCILLVLSCVPATAPKNTSRAPQWLPPTVAFRLRSLPVWHAGSKIHLL